MTTKQKPAKVLNSMLWLAQTLLALTFLWAGWMKLFNPEALPFPWVKEHTRLVLITGFIDLLAGIGITFPTLFRIQPKLTVYAAFGIMLLMIAASIFHITRGEAQDIGFNLFMVVLAGFVVWGRRKKLSYT